MTGCTWLWQLSSLWEVPPPIEISESCDKESSIVIMAKFAHINPERGINFSTRRRSLNKLAAA